ncbi:MAG TPA: SRPBCC family protein [Candidatus Limnocylindrales bacterium]|jgi:carbon monoxide dehydrogenase subunit G
MAILPSVRRTPPPGAPGSRSVERRTYVQASPRDVWIVLHDPAQAPSLFPEVALEPAAPTWPAAATTRRGLNRLGPIGGTARVESLEARPGSTFRVRVDARGVRSEWTWVLEPRAGGTRVVHVATIEPRGRFGGLLVRLAGASLPARVEGHLTTLKQLAESSPTSRRS